MQVCNQVNANILWQWLLHHLFFTLVYANAPQSKETGGALGHYASMDAETFSSLLDIDALIGSSSNYNPNIASNHGSSESSGYYTRGNDNAASLRGERGKQFYEASGKKSDSGYNDGSGYRKQSHGDRESYGNKIDSDSKGLNYKGSNYQGNHAEGDQNEGAKSEGHSEGSSGHTSHKKDRKGFDESSQFNNGGAKKKLYDHSQSGKHGSSYDYVEGFSSGNSGYTSNADGYDIKSGHDNSGGSSFVEKGQYHDDYDYNFDDFGEHYYGQDDHKSGADGGHKAESGDKDHKEKTDENRGGYAEAKGHSEYKGDSQHHGDKHEYGGYDSFEAEDREGYANDQGGHSKSSQGGHKTRGAYGDGGNQRSFDQFRNENKEGSYSGNRGKKFHEGHGGDSRHSTQVHVKHGHNYQPFNVWQGSHSLQIKRPIRVATAKNPHSRPYNEVEKPLQNPNDHASLSSSQLSAANQNGKPLKGLSSLKKHENNGKKDYLNLPYQKSKNVNSQRYIKGLSEGRLEKHPIIQKQNINKWVGLLNPYASFKKNINLKPSGANLRDNSYRKNNPRIYHNNYSKPDHSGGNRQPKKYEETQNKDNYETIPAGFSVESSHLNKLRRNPKTHQIQTPRLTDKEPATYPKHPSEITFEARSGEYGGPQEQKINPKNSQRSYDRLTSINGRGLQDVKPIKSNKSLTPSVERITPGRPDVVTPVNYLSIPNVGKIVKTPKGYFIFDKGNYVHFEIA